MERSGLDTSTLPVESADPGVAMASLLMGSRGGDSLLVQFGDFFAELLRLKYALAAGRLHGAGNGDEGGLTPADLAGLVHQRLRVLLEAQAARARHWGGSYGESLYREAQYVMAALADETMLLRVQWEGRAVWQDRLLETALFGTRVAGERVFERLDALLADDSRVPADLATIYLVALALGFRGRCWRPEDDGELRVYRTALARIIAREDPALAREAAPLFEQAYGHTIEQGRAVRLPHLRPWLLVGSALFVLYLAGSHTLWIALIFDLDQTVHRIEKIERIDHAGSGQPAE
ncbi:DotU family type IV/VI secretion system protein [Azospirillum agricola]|uniref:DotU family type IV/VI secretion system protein n=1 Tax=Azospirillum agricola TaxID=1720247 RepID=UPI000A0F0EED|nr:DotU family type IV/VI secretion system protein [Azospirillum agricola]SMH63020.1 type VI secretion system protein ImpK [Azospirillum lipoferum]